MQGTLEAKKIKSAQRVLEIFDYFSTERPDAKVTDLALTLGYPQSSTSELLGCLVSLGYLKRNHATRTYRPTARVPLLGAWVEPKLFRRGHLLALIGELSEELGLPVLLANKAGQDCRILHMATPLGVARVQTAEQSLLESTAGKLLLSVYKPDALRKIVSRVNAETEDSSRRVSFASFNAEIEDIRRKRYAAGDDGFIGILLPATRPDAAPDERLALLLGLRRAASPEHHEYYVKILRDAVSRHFRLTPPCP